MEHLCAKYSWTIVLFIYSFYFFKLINRGVCQLSHIIGFILQAEAMVHNYCDKSLVYLCKFWKKSVGDSLQI
jgi:hypothetical protein